MTPCPASSAARASLHRGIWLLPLLATLGLAACGGDAGPADADAGTASPFDHSAPYASRPPLVDDEGRIAAGLPQARPEDPGVRTRTARYATAAQAAELEQALGNDAIRVEVGCCGAEAAELATGTVHGLQAAHDLGADAPVLVHGHDLRLAAVVADRLGDAGHARVWLVTR